MRPASAFVADPDLGARAIETDRIYFELGARLSPLDGATLAWMPGLTASAAAAVIHRVDPAAIASGGDGWVDAAERALAGAGVRLARIYLDQANEEAGVVLAGRGYRSRDELVFAGTLDGADPSLSLRPVTSDEDWADKLRFQVECDSTPDGHPNRADEWVALERRKSGPQFAPFLAEQDGRVVGAIGAVWGAGVVRCKNVAVHPDLRRRRLGTAMLGAIATLGRARGVSHQCVMAVSGEPGEQLYRSAGLEVAAIQVEWWKPLEGGR